MGRTDVGFEVPLTKIRQPYSRAEATVARTALVERLAQATASKRVVLVQAVAGYGKSLTVSRALDALPGGVPKVWISLDEGDSLRTVVECLTVALEPFDAPWRSDPVSWVNDVQAPGSRGLRADAAAFVNAMAAIEASHAVVVFDDLHSLTDPSALRFVELLVEQLDERWSVVLLTRTPPPFSLAKIAASGDLVTLRETDFAFSIEETRELCKDLAPEAADAVWRQTRGWPAGVRLALTSFRANADLAATATIDASVFDFLIAEVIDRLPEDLRQFLLQISVLPEVSAWQAESLTGAADAARMLEEVERRSLFVADVGGAERVLRFHDLFREALNRRARTEPSIHIGTLLRRASRVEADPFRKIEYLLEAEAWTDAARQLMEYSPVALLSGAIDQVQRLLGRFPALVRIELPELLFIEGLLALERWDWAKIAPVMRQASALWQSMERHTEAQEAATFVPLALAGIGEVHAARVQLAKCEGGAPNAAAEIRNALTLSWLLLAEGDLDKVGEALTRTVNGLVESDAPAYLWKLAQPLPAFVGLPQTRPSLTAWVQGALRRTGDSQSSLRGMALVLKSWLALRAGEWDDAKRWYSDAFSECEWLHRPQALAFQLDLLKAQLLATEERKAELEHHLSRMLATSEQSDAVRHRSAAKGLILYLGCRLANQAGHIELAQRLGSELIRDPSSYIGWISTECLPGIRAVLHEGAGRKDEAYKSWTQQVDLASCSDLYGHVAEARMHAVALALETNRVSDAVALIQPLLDRAEADAEPGLLQFAHPSVRARVFAFDWPAGLASRLGRLGLRTEMARPAEVYLDARTSVADVPPAPTSTEVNADDLGLSVREIEVLAQLARGASNKEIARSFDISPFTIKRHVGNILNKLGLQSRGQAAAWYHQHRPTP